MLPFPEWNHIHDVYIPFDNTSLERDGEGITCLPSPYDHHPQLQLDCQLHLGHRRRRAPRRVRSRQVPRRHSPDDRAATA